MEATTLTGGETYALIHILMDAIDLIHEQDPTSPTIGDLRRWAGELSRRGLEP